MKFKQIYSINNKEVSDIFHERTTSDVDKDIAEMYHATRIIRANITNLQDLLKRNFNHFPQHKELNKNLNNISKELENFIKKTSY